MRAQDMLCPLCDQVTATTTRKRTIEFKGEDITVQYEADYCASCDLETADVQVTANLQKLIADEYRKKLGLLTSQEIIRLRGLKGFSQHALAERTGFGIASIKRWETGAVQSKANDSILRTTLLEKTCECSGERALSFARIKLVLLTFSESLNRSLLKRGDRFLYAAKYLWYSDMLSYKRYGISITGATYAKLPRGPQLNNYRDLIPEIFDATPTQEDSLSEKEIEIIKLVAKEFPTNNSIFEASHEEEIWEEKPTGSIIPYSSAERLNAI